MVIAATLGITVGALSARRPGGWFDRLALSLTYLGISYGTFLGATYANLFPKRVRAIIVDGDFKRKLRLKKSLVEQNVQANGHPLPISR